MSEEGDAVASGGDLALPTAVRLAAECPLSAWTGTLGHCLWCDAVLDATSLDPAWWCSYACRGRYRYNHEWPWARRRAVSRSRGWCSRPRCRSRVVEVNHLVPLVGRGYGPGHEHHQSGLETVCRAHHVIETTRQLRERRGLPTRTREELLAEVETELAATTTCLAPTRSGAPCSRWVDPGTVCWQHRGRGDAAPLGEG